MLLDIDRPITDEDLDHKNRAMRTYKRITILRVSQRCGMCGTTRHSTKGFWSLGMRVCKHCMQANLVSSKVLYERFWINMSKPVSGYPTFIDAVASRVFYFEHRSTPTQRMDFTVDPCDFPGGIRSLWFFWRPHLAKVMDMEELARTATAKHAAAALIRSSVRRALIQRQIRGTTGKAIKHDRRSLLFKMRKTQLMDRVSQYNDTSMLARLDTMLGARLYGWEDKVVPPTTDDPVRHPG